MEWLFEYIDATRPHFISFEVSWHARFMFVAWTFLVPLGIFSARFFKVMPNQNWPEILDNKTWWFSHLTFQYFAGILMLAGLWMIWSQTGSYTGSIANIAETAILHKWLGWLTIVLCGVQYLAGWLRGTKGGPTEVEQTGTIRGDHYDMTKRRVIFEYVHKITGYVCLLASFIATVAGLWMVNAPNWMWLVLVLWWVIVITLFVKLQKAGRAIDTYHAIWGEDPELPGNQTKPIGWGVRKDLKSNK